jgi:hypothetical protein
MVGCLSGSVAVDVTENAERAARDIWRKYGSELYSPVNFSNFVNILNGGICNQQWSTLEGTNKFKQALANQTFQKMRKDYLDAKNVDQKRNIAEMAYIAMFPFRNNKMFSDDVKEVDDWLKSTPKDVDKRAASYQGMLDRRIVDHMGRIYKMLLPINKQMASALLEMLKMKKVIKHEK